MNQTALELSEIYLGKAIDECRISHYNQDGSMSRDVDHIARMKPIEDELGAALNKLQRVISERDTANVERDTEKK